MSFANNFICIASLAGNGKVNRRRVAVRCREEKPEAVLRCIALHWRLVKWKRRGTTTLHFSSTMSWCTALLCSRKSPGRSYRWTWSDFKNSYKMNKFSCIVALFSVFVFIRLKVHPNLIAIEETRRRGSFLSTNPDRWCDVMNECLIGEIRRKNCRATLIFRRRWKRGRRTNILYRD